MSTTLSTATIGEHSFFDTDYVFDGITVPANTSTASSAFQFGRAQNRLELIVTAKTAINVTENKVFSITKTTCDTKAGEYANSETIYTVTGASGDTTIAAGTELAYISPTLDDNMWTKLTMTTDDTGATGTVDAKIGTVA